MISPLLIAKVFGATSSLAAAVVGAAFGIGSIISDNKPDKDTDHLPPAEGTDDASDAPDQPTEHTPVTPPKQTKAATVTAPTPQQLKQQYEAYGARLTANPKATAKVVVVKTSSITGDSQITLKNQNTAVNHKCNVTGNKSQASFKCKIFTLDTTKKWVDLTTIKTPTTSSTINQDDFADVTKYFKVEVEEDFYSQLALDSSNQIDLVSDTNPETTYATVTALFKVADDAAVYTKATHLLGKGPSTKSAATTSASGQSYCFVTSSSESTGIGRECRVLPFGTAVPNSNSTAKYSDQTLTYAEAKSETTVENKYYLVRWTSLHDHLKSNGLTDKLNLQITTSYAVTSSSTPKLTDLIHVIVSGTDDKAVAFILSTHTPLSS